MNLRLRLGLFALVAVASVVFAGVQYVGIPQRYLGQSYRVSVNLPDSGGIFPNAEVTLRGVAVGRVESLHLTPDGVRADLRIEDDVRIPRDTLVKVAHLSAVGEQYVNLLPQVDDGPYLDEGEALPVSAATTPLRVTRLLVHLDRLATSIGKPQLRTVVAELGRAFDDSGQDLQTLLVRARELSGDLADVQPATRVLLRDGERVLRTQDDLAGDLQRLSTGLEQLTDTLVEADPDLRSLLDDAPRTLTEVRDLLAENGPEIGVLLGNLLSVTEIVAAPVRLRGLNTQLVLLPRIVQGTFNIQPGDGFARLGAVIDTSQAVCTQGYESSGKPPTQGTDVSDVPGNPSMRANLNAFCALPPSSGVAVRGAANVPRPPGDPTATVLPRPNPRGFGPGSSFRDEPAPDDAADAGAPSDPVEQRLAAPPSSVAVVGPTGLRGLLLGQLRPPRKGQR